MSSTTGEKEAEEKDTEVKTDGARELEKNETLSKTRIILLELRYFNFLATKVCHKRHLSHWFVKYGLRYAYSKLTTKQFLEKMKGYNAFLKPKCMELEEGNRGDYM